MPDLSRLVSRIASADCFSLWFQAFACECNSYHYSAGVGGSVLVGNALCAAGDSVEVIQNTASKKKKEQPTNRFRMAGDDDVQGRWLGALGQPLDGRAGGTPGCQMGYTDHTGCHMDHILGVIIWGVLTAK
jgi:hypothetical protein